MTSVADAAQTTCAGATSVVLRKLSVRAGQQVLLHEASARFKAGEVTLIVGRSGAGKSTLLRAIAGLIDQQQDELSADGSRSNSDDRVAARSGNRW